MWTKLEVGDLPLLERWVYVMRRMSRHYHGLRLDSLRGNMRSSGGQLWYYRLGECEAALRFQHNPKRNVYQLLNVGVVGLDSPDAAIELIVEKCRQVLEEQGLRSVVAIRPKNMNDPLIESFHLKIPARPDLQVDVLRDNPDKIMWRITYVGIRESDSHARCGPLVAGIT